MDTSFAPSATGAGTRESPLDLLIVGAGLSGINLAHHVSQAFPSWDWELHDTHDDLGGTWHTFRYPGIRSDSDMATFGFPFRPWPHESTLGEGAEIKEYLRDTARESGALDRLHLRSWVKSADWISSEYMYRVTTLSNDPGTSGQDGVERTIWARRLHFASGYYSHDRGYRPSFPGEENFEGRILHPQDWPEDMDCAGRRFVVIGSGATAVTLVPALVALGAEVTMVQRSPSYIGPLPDKDRISALWQRVLPARPAYRMARFTHSARDMTQYLVAQRLPWVFTAGLRAMQRRYLSGEQIARHFTPSYRPWDQRVCKAPDGDLFRVLGRGAEIVTDTIDTFTTHGIRVSSGHEIDADIVVTATGLELEAFGGATVSIDGDELDPASLVAYRGVMLSGVPNFSFTVGYINASWTLRADMVSKYMVKLWKSGVLPYAPTVPTDHTTRPLLDFEAGYIKRGSHRFPKQGRTHPWTFLQNYLAEIPLLGFGDQRKDMLFGEQVTEKLNRSTPKGSSDAASSTH